MTYLIHSYASEHQEYLLKINLHSRLMNITAMHAYNAQQITFDAFNLDQILCFLILSPDIFTLHSLLSSPNERV